MVSAVDTHAHIFTKDLPLVKGHRYALGYEATLQQYIQVLDEHRLSHGVLVQPSFLGTDNRYLLAALGKYPTRLRGVVVIDPTTHLVALRAMDAQGVRGIRLNLVGQGGPDLASAAWQTFLGLLAEVNWHVELHVEASRLPTLLPLILKQKVKVSIDHFGRPDPALEVDDPGFKYLLSVGPSKQVWVKISGAYRCSHNADAGQAFALRAVPLLEESFGLRQLLWGSDWPNVGYEKVTNYDKQYALMQSVLRNDAVREAVMAESPAEFYRF